LKKEKKTQKKGSTSSAFSFMKMFEKVGE